jgi:hypothetical protein
MYPQPEQSRGHKRKLRAKPEQPNSDSGLGWCDGIATVETSFCGLPETNSDFQNLFLMLKF